jgi:pimeloyl-ACP methyl ester carboxylesterase
MTKPRFGTLQARSRRGPSAESHGVRDGQLCDRAPAAALLAMASLYWTVEGDGPSVVLLDAGGLDSRMFERDMSELALSARVLRYDRSGSGRSPAWNGPVDRVEELRMVRAMAFGERPAVLVGCSLGGQLGVDFALSYPALVVGLLLVGPGLSGAEVSDDRRARMASPVAAAGQGGDELTDAWPRDSHLAPHGFRARRRSWCGRCCATTSSPARVLCPASRARAV